MTPSSPAPSKRRNQSSARVRSRVAGERCTGGGASASTCSSRSRRTASVTSRRSSLPSASRSQTTNEAGASAARSFTRDAAGWMRRSSASKSSPPAPTMTISPSTTQRSGSVAVRGATSSGKYRFIGFSSRLCSTTSSPSRNTNVRKPSHLGSNCQPSPPGKASAALDSMGASGGAKGRRISRARPVEGNRLLVRVGGAEQHVLPEMRRHEHQADRQPLRLPAGDAEGGMARVVEGAGVGDHGPEVHAELAAEQRVLERLFVVHGLAPPGGTEGHGGHGQEIDAGQDPVVLRDEAGTDVLRLGVETPAVVLLQVVALHQVELEIRRELPPVALLEATEDRDERARIVGSGERASAVRVVHPLAALEADGQQGEQRPRVKRHVAAL